MKIKCCLVFGNPINCWNKIKDMFKKHCEIITFIVFIVLAYVFTCLLMGNFKLENVVDIATGSGGIMALYLFHLRNKEMAKQTESQYKIFNEDKQFSNFLEATKLLTNKGSTAEAKIAAMFSLADVAKEHPDHIDRIMQVINKELIPLMKVIEGNDNAKIYTDILKEKRTAKQLGMATKKIQTFGYTKNKLLSIESLKNKRKMIKNWQYTGDETEKVVSVALYVIRKIVLGIETNKFDFSNTIFFDIDKVFDNKLKKNFIRKKKRIENAVFLNCILKKFDFRKTNFHYCKFINCSLDHVKFKDANLWGTSFENCNLKKVKFDKAKCEGVEFKDCKKLKIEQLDKMEFKNIKEVKEYFNKEDLKYLVIIDKIDNIDKGKSKLSENNFLTMKEYNEWKNSDKN